MLKKRFRLKSSELFTQALRGRRFYVDNAFVVYTVNRSEPQPGQLPQFGLIISRKTEKRAARRNRAKRQFREIIRTRLIPEHPVLLNPFKVVVIILRPPALTCTYDELCQKMVRCFETGTTKKGEKKGEKKNQ